VKLKYQEKTVILKTVKTHNSKTQNFKIPKVKKLVIHVTIIYFH